MLMYLKTAQKYKDNADVSEGQIIGPTLFLLFNNLRDGVVCDAAIYEDDTMLNSNSVGFWTWIWSKDWDRMWLADFNPEKTCLTNWITRDVSRGFLDLFSRRFEGRCPQKLKGIYSWFLKNYSQF